MTEKLEKTKERPYYWKELDVFDAKEISFSIFDAIQEGVIIIDCQGLVRYVNPAFVRISGVHESEMLDKNVMELHPEGPLAKVIANGEPIYDERHKMIHRGIEVTASTMPVKANKKIIGAVSIFRDITEVLKLSAKLTETKKTINELHSKISNMFVAKYGFEDMIGVSSVFLESIEMAKRAAQTDSTVLLRGESGTGKELFASSIHKRSLREEKPFIKVNCAAVPDNLLESEFFGYEKGAFTGATTRKLGMFELAHGGTIFLDEIGDMNPTLQVKLLRVLEEGEIFRLGGTKPIDIDVRVIAATNRDLSTMVKEGEFREDLFYRLNVINVEIPPLRDRKEDIPLLANFMVDKISCHLGKVIKKISPDAYRILIAHEWPGNVRELRNCIEKAIIISEGEVISKEGLHFLLPDEEEILENGTVVPLDALEKEMIKRALDQYGTSVNGKKEAAVALNISLRTLYNKLNKYELA